MDCVSYRVRIALRSMLQSFRFSIDRGGTFTDIFCEIRDAQSHETLKVITSKLLSEDPSNYKDAPTEGIRRLLEQETGKPHPRGAPVATSQIEYIRMGTTVATNALLERKGERIALLTTSGFKDLQIIGNQSRPRIFDLEIRRPDLLYEVVCEVDERVTLLKTSKDVQSAKKQFVDEERIVTGISKDKLLVETPLDREGVREQLEAVRDKGITSVAIVFMHSYTFNAHEKQAKAIAEELGFTQISLSCEVMPMVRIVPRGCTTCVDAYLTPIIKKYLANFSLGFDEGLKDVQVSFMQSDGGLTPMDSFSGNRAILSGPAGGVVGYARTSYHHDDGPAASDETQCAVIGFDMGGTSTDVSRYDGVYEHVFETVTAGVTVQSPQLDINTVAAGGGSRLFYRNGLFVVGPESAGAHPGPVCYRKGGHLAVTDANVMLGRIQPHLFPAIFGPDEKEQLDYDATRAAFEAITRKVNEGGEANKYSVDEVAYGFIRVANEAMARPIRNLTTMKGHNVTKHALSCFGGAGPQHCCAIAKSLGMRKIYVHRYSGILSAYGLGLADVVVEKQEPFSGEPLSHPRVLQQAEAELDRLEGHASEELLERGFPHGRIQVTRYLNCRYQGTDTCIMISVPQGPAASSSSSSSLTSSRVTSRSSSIGELPVECDDDEEDKNEDEDRDREGGSVPPPPPPTPTTLPSSPNESDSESTGTNHSSAAPQSKTFFNRIVDRMQNLALGRPRLPSVDLTLSSIKNRFATGSASSQTDYEAEFTARYRREYGFELTGRPVLVEDVRVRVVGKSPPAVDSSDTSHGSGGPAPAAAIAAPPAPAPKEVVLAYFEGGRRDTPVYYLNALPAGVLIEGPAIIVQDVATVVVEPQCTAVVSPGGDIEITVLGAKDSLVTQALDPVYLSIFGHRFMGIAEQMGRTLQRTSISVNIKERLDFSCALFDAEGGLVANAPHLPVHLGAMSEAVRYQIKHWQGRDGGMKEGDVLVSNHPQLAGGSHLPDITVITPVFHEEEIQFFVASRGHHADVGGISPGSMPPLSKTLDDEGAAIVAFKLVQGGVFQEKGMSALLHAPGKLTGNCGTRNLSDNLSDLRAQVAANTRGVQLMQELVGEYGLGVVKAYMGHIQDCAEASVRNMLREFSVQRGLPDVGTVQAEDFLDDGTPIRLCIEINRRDGSAVFDFSGTGAEMYANLNAPPAVTSSAIIYCLRCLLPNTDIPLNQGCLTPITIKIPLGSVLNPSPKAAVVGGNVLTSQRVTDVVLRAFEACAASQGCMNNLTFGNATMGYYETIAGGAGAGPSWHGCSGVQTHMTNTRLTDAEILEKRYPVILRHFGLRRGSGGAGYYAGGDGVDRVLEFTEDLAVSILSERRAFQPYGMCGGLPGSRGVNLLHIPAQGDGESEKTISLGGKNTVQVHRGWALQILTPGGGGYGEEKEGATPANKEPMVLERTSGTVNQYTMAQESV